MQKTTAKDMTEGPILRQLIAFALPLMLGNVFQMLYNTVDSVIVGNFVSKQALAAIGSTTMIVNLFVFFFNGFSIGAGVVIGQYFGARDMEKLHDAIETTMAATFILSLLFSLLSFVIVDPLLRMMSTPEDVFHDASVYLRIYLGGIAGLLIFNMGSGVLRAVGDSTRPLYFLIFTSLLNIALDLFFVLVLKMGVAGAAVATIMDVMAGWSSYNKLDQFIMLPMQSMAMSATTFVSQNIGAGNDRRSDRGTVAALGLTCAVTGSIIALLVAYAPGAVRLFSPDEAVIRYGVLFIRTNVVFLLFNCINHVLAGALRGRGDSRGPMIIMLASFVALRQIYLFVVTHYFANTPRIVGIGYPVGWVSCCAAELLYFALKRRKRLAAEEKTRPGDA